MSTKIYDAYKVKINSIAELREFRKDLTKTYWHYCYKELFQHIVFGVLIDLTESMPHKANHYLCEADKIIKNIASKTTFEDAAKELSSKNVISAAVDYANDIFERQEKNRIPRGIKGIIAAYEHAEQKDHMIFMGFGLYFTKFLSEVCFKEDSEYKDFKEKWDLSDYHYQNQTDQPDDISDEEWLERERVWDKVMDTSVPNEDSIIIQILNADQFQTMLQEYIFKTHQKDAPYYAQVLNDVLTAMPDKETRLDTMAKEQALYQYVRSHERLKEFPGIEEAKYALHREFNIKLENNDAAITELLNTCKTEIEPFLLNFEDPEIKHDLLKKNVFDFTKLEVYAAFRFKK